MPVAASIQWKPLRDSYYVIASLQPGGGGRRQIFARQSTLREIQALARRDPEQPVVGLLLGERLDCSITLTPYVLIESHVEVALPSFDERAVSNAIRTLRGHVGGRNPVEVLGWYCRSRSADATVSRTHAAVHAECFREPWQTVLTFGDGGNAGAFFLHDSIAARWFHAPFYEVGDAKASGRPPKATCVAWPAYLTTESVIPLTEAPPRVFVAAPVSPPARQHSVASARPVVIVRRTPARDAIVGVGRAAVAAHQSALGLARILGGRAVTASRHAAERIGRFRAERAASAAQRKAEADAARAEARRANEAADRRAAREETQRRAAEAEAQDHEDTTASDGPYRYLALARREGFEMSERIERGSPEHPETVWLLHDRESGLRLIVVTTDEAVREASLHYNLRTEDDSLLRVTAPEHRDLESRTIYGREACLHDLRARCRRLRATGALERDWKVSPTFEHPVSPR